MSDLHTLFTKMEHTKQTPALSLVLVYMLAGAILGSFLGYFVTGPIIGWLLR